MTEQSPALWRPHLALGITGHRPDNPVYAGNREAAEKALLTIFEIIAGMRDEIAAEHRDGQPREVRLHSLLAGGVDQIAAHFALLHGWHLVAPLPFGRGLNLAINAEAKTRSDVLALCEGQPASDLMVEAEAASIRALLAKACVFEIADRDEEIRDLLIASHERPDDLAVAHRLQALRSDNVALAGRIMVERSDLLIALWDRKRTDLAGGTGHTVLAALENGTPVLVVDVAHPDGWSILTRPEELGHAHEADEAANDAPDHARLRAIVEAAFAPISDGFHGEEWKPKSPFFTGFYRRIEQLFGGRTTSSGTLQSRYEAPEQIASGKAAELLEKAHMVLANDAAFDARLRDEVLPVFARADGIASRLSDIYRSGMAVNFLLSAFAIIAGIAYLPFDLAKYKWIFASVELVMLTLILTITYAGYRLAWHRRWFETRRVAEYLRFAPAIAIMGIARPVGRWPRGENKEWPERFSRDLLRDIGLPEAKADREYLRTVLEGIVRPHVETQLQYHEAKSRQLARVHHRIDRTAEACFLAAFVAVAIYLLIEAGVALGIIAPGVPYSVAKVFTFMGVAFPTLGANLAGLRYFGDFERFSAISSVTAQRLGDIRARIDLLLSGDPARLTYRAASGVVQTVDEAVVAEIESWQAVFGAKHLALPA